MSSPHWPGLTGDPRIGGVSDDDVAADDGARILVDQDDLVSEKRVIEGELVRREPWSANINKLLIILHKLSPTLANPFKNTPNHPRKLNNKLINDTFF